MRIKLLTITILAAIALASFVHQTAAADRPGYTDTPMLPAGKWHVHDPNRPVPPIVAPGKTFSDGAPPPSDAVILFNGQDLSKWQGTKGPAPWKVQDGYMEVVPHSGSIRSRDKFGSFQMHLEFAEPTHLRGTSQERGNSGVIIFGLYEVQVLDNFNNPTYPDGQCGGLYGQSPPLVNACRPPGEWQTYDILFESPRWDADNHLIRPASVTVIQNGLVLHHKQALLGPTAHRAYGDYKRNTGSEGAIELQEHENPVRFRNIWIRNISDEEKP
jgi:hypothetical protein